jgi:hypothetical protein
MTAQGAADNPKWQPDPGSMYELVRDLPPLRETSQQIADRLLREYWKGKGR